MAGNLLTSEDAVGILQSGGVLLMGTDTLPGFHCRADRAEAVDRILELKGREKGKSLLVLAGSAAQAELVTGALDHLQSDYCRRCWPGPFSLILPAGDCLSPSIKASKGTVAVRVPAVPSLRRLVLAVEYPLVSTSANLAGQPPFTSLETAQDHFMDKVDGVWQPEENKKDMNSSGEGVPSALIDVTLWPPRPLRAGPCDPPPAG